MNKKITTIDDLAGMIEKESRVTGRRFDTLEEKMEKIVVDIKEIRTDVAGIHSQIKEIRVDIKNVDTRTAVISIGNRVSKLEGTV